MPEANTGESVPVESTRPDRAALLSAEIMFVGQKPGCPTFKALAV